MIYAFKTNIDSNQYHNFVFVKKNIQCHNLYLNLEIGMALKDRISYMYFTINN